MTSSKNLKKQIQGAQAQSVGKAWETHFKMQCNSQGVAFVQIPTGAKRTPQGWKLKKSPFDFIIAKDGEAACLDTKTVGSGNFPRSAINTNQMEKLLAISEGLAAGYLVWFRDTDNIVFFEAMQLVRLKKRESLKQTAGLLVGNINNYKIKNVLGRQPVRSKKNLFD